ncbi:MAG TPA: hypothetical protein VMJ34_02120 [Bryobacteraceae bacterium]|nr:hypothetical protein [Bryobacteraceae bacterium]
MDYLIDENRPETCLALGLDCRTCVHKSASSVAHVCHDLDSTGVRRIFERLYTSPGCAAMVGAFEQAYFDATPPARKPVLVALTLGNPAVAA